MRILFVIFVLSVGALLWAAIAIARHIRRHEPQLMPPEPEMTESDPIEHDVLVVPNSRHPEH